MSVESSGHDENYIRVLRRRFRAWRGNRPFWAGLLTIMGGVPIGWLPYAEIKIGHLTLAMATTAGAGSLIIGVLLVTLGLTMWFHHIVRVFAGVAAILLALVSIPVSNLGAFFIGFLLALLGGALSISWVPDKSGGAAESAESADADGSDEKPHADVDPYPAQGPDSDPFMSDTSVDANGGRNSAG